MPKASWTWTIFDNTIFSKGLIDSFGNNNMPTENTPDCRNIRLQNWSSTIRKGFSTIVANSAWTYIRGIVSNSNLFVVRNKQFSQVDISAGTYTDKWAVSTTDKDVNFVTYWTNTIILNWEDYPYVWDGTNISQLGAGNIEADANPLFWTVFADFTVVAGTWTKSNNIYISKPITASDITDAYDWADATADIRSMKSDVLGLVGTLNRLYVFCDASIEYMDRSTTATVGWSTVFYTKPIAEGDKLASYRSIVAAWEKIFFLTQDKKIKTLNYVQWVAELAVGEISDQDWRSISLFMEGLDADQSESMWYLHRGENIIKRHLKTESAKFNDVILVYDLTSQTFLVDDNKFFSCVTEHNRKYYTGSHINSDLTEDEVDYDDDDSWTPRYRWTKKMFLGDPLVKKRFRGVWLNWQINTVWEINIEVFIDGFKEWVTETITWSWTSPWVLWTGVIAGAAIADEAISGDPIQPSILNLVDFNKKIGKGKIKRKWKYIQIKLSGNAVSSRISLDSLSIDVKSVWDVNISDKL